MARITIIFGFIFIILGVGAYFLTGRQSVTALIPAFFGLPLAVLGVLAIKESMRKHAMHIAVIVAVLGFLGTARSFASLPTLFTGEEVARPSATIVQFVMALLCLVYIILCVQSFIKARRST